MASTAERSREPVAFDYLRARSVGLGGVLFQSVTGMAPASGLAFSIGITAVFAGIVSPLAVLLATIACLLVATCIGQLAKHVMSAGGLYMYISRSLGPSVGFIAGWGFALMELMVTPLVCLLLAWVTSDVFKNDIGLNLGWAVWVVASLAVVFGLTYRDVRISIKAGAWLGIAELIIFGGLAVWMIVAHRSHLPHGVFDPSHVPGKQFSGLFKGMLFGVLAFGGFEAAAAFGEEARRPRWTIPRAVILAVLAMGAFYLVGVYGWIAGAGTKGFLAQTTAGGNQWIPLAKVFWGEGWILVFLALVNSNLAAANAQVNATSRMFYAMGRNGLLPQPLARTHQLHKTPHVAITITVLASLVVALLAGAKWGPLLGFAVLATVYTIILILLYMAVALSSAVFYLREERTEFNPLLHGIVPAVALILFGFALYYQYSPLPAAPMVVGNWVALGWMVVSLFALAAVKRWLPDGLHRARLVFVDGGAADAAQAADPVSIGERNV